MTTVSVNAFDDADLLYGCLESVRELLPHVRIQVIDGRYDAFPAPADNSTDNTSDVCNAFGAEYWPDGPFADEPAKHWQRIERAPNNERVLFMDSDERLVTFDDSTFEENAIYRVRIHDAACYSGNIVYYARYFYPEQMDDIPRVDRFWFGDDPETTEERTDSITITHRADLRGSEYQTAKAQRVREAQDRAWYDEYLKEFNASELDFEICPNCGNASLRISSVCGYRKGDEFTQVETCVASDRCYAAVKPVDGPNLPEDWIYVPDALDEGFETDIERVRMELMAAGNPVARIVSGEAFERYEPNAKIWVREELKGEGLSRAK